MDKETITNKREKAMRIELKSETYNIKEGLKSLGYRWDGKSWNKEINSTIESMTVELDSLYAINYDVDGLLNETAFVNETISSGIFKDENDVDGWYDTVEEKYEEK